MSCGYNQCYFSAPASTVTIQPPPFVLSIPGPSLYCPDQPLCIDQHNPCAMVPYCERGSRSRYGSFFGGGFCGFGSASLYRQKSLSQKNITYDLCQHY